MINFDAPVGLLIDSPPSESGLCHFVLKRKCGAFAGEKFPQVSFGHEGMTTRTVFLEGHTETV